MRTEVAQDRAQLGPRRVTDTKVLAILRLYRDRRLVALDPRFPCGGFGLLRTRLVSPVQLLHFLDPLIEIIQAVPHEETPCVGLYGNRPHMEHTLNDALTLGVAAPHALHANRSRVQIPEKLVDAGTTEHSPDVLLNALSLRRRMNIELNFPPNFERLVLGCIDADFCKKYSLELRSI